jgi:mono/diheme cytochrome c family protein
MNRITALILVCLIYILPSCKSTQPTVSSTTVSPTAASVEVKPATPAPVADAVANGKTVYQAKCYQCHDLPNAASYTQSEWSDIMIKMSRKAHLSETETAQVLAFVNANARQ